MKNRTAGRPRPGPGALIPTGAGRGVDRVGDRAAAGTAAAPRRPTAAPTEHRRRRPTEPAPARRPTVGARARCRARASPRSRSTSIVPNPKQPRQVFDEEALEELKISIQEVGFLQPIVVRELGDGKYELVMGERRWRAAQAVGQGRSSRRSSGTPATTRCCATRCWRTSTGPT